MSARAALRAATRNEHEAVDALFGRFDPADPDGYRRFLSAHRAAFAPIERAIDRAGGDAVLEDWPKRRRAALLEADAADMGVEETLSLPPPSLASPAEVLGAIYVLEGSRLGGALLRRGVSPSWPARFLNAPAEPGTWQTLIAKLEAALARPEDLQAAISAAKAVFRCFEAAGQDNRECVQRA